MATVVADDVEPPSKSTQTFLTAFVGGTVIAAAYVLVFMVIRYKFRKVYNPRAFLVEPRKRVVDLPRGFFAWFPAILKADSKQIIEKNGLDAYCFMRFLYLMMEIFFPFWMVTWVIILPIDIAGSDGSNIGIERWTMGNIGVSQTPRYGAHLVVVYLLTFWVFYLLRREMANFVVLRQDFLMSREHAMLPQARTVLVTGVAKEWLSSKAIKNLCNVLPGGVSRVWLARNMKELPGLQDRCTSACSKLESAETKLLKMASKAVLQMEAASSKSAEKGRPASPADFAKADGDKLDSSRFVASKDRPHHKLGFLGLWGEKVDSINWSRQEISATNKLIEASRAVFTGPDSLVQYPAESAAFILFNSQMAAHLFVQCLTHHTPLRMASRYVEVDHDDVIWSNLSVNPYQARVRYALSWALTVGLLIAWTFPVAFIGLLSNVSSLCQTVKWAAWLCKLPSPINGVIQGLLPPAALGIIFIVLPIVLRLFARFQGIPLKTQIELSLMDRYFLFLVIHGFLVVTLASGLIAALPGIAKDPTSAITILANKLPAASTFFLTYFVTTALGGASGSLLQIVTLVIYWLKMFILGSTPRAVYKIKFELEEVEWGTLFPNMTLLTCIGLVYSVIAPLVSGFACISFAMFWFVYKYLFIWVYDTPASKETGGLFYPKALSHIVVGLYIEQFCLAGLFFLARDSQGHASAIPEAALIVVLIVFTIFYQNTLNTGYAPLISNLPLSFHDRIDRVRRSGEEHDALLAGGATESRVEIDAEEEKMCAEPSEDFLSFPPHRRESDDTMVATGRQGSTGKSSTLLSINESIQIPLVEESGGVPPSHRLEKHAFDHPAGFEEQRIVWIPKDVHGFYEQEVLATEAAGVAVSSVGALMDAKGQCDAVRSPPGEEWNH